MADLDELFSRLKTQQSSSKSTDLGDASVASIWDKQTPSPASSIPGLPIRQIMPRGATEQSMSNNLLNLLNINRGQTSATPQRSSSAVPQMATPVVPGFARLASESPALPPRLSGDAEAAPEPPANTQRFLLDLLNKPGQSVSTPHVKTPDLTKTDQAAIDRLAQSFSNSASAPKAETPGKANRFTYVNPFDQLHASSPLTLPARPAEKEKEVIEETVEEKTVSVSEKLEQVGEQASKAVSKALDQALAQTAKEEDDVRSSWSTAEDEDSKKEEQDKVEVYNFPMRPFVMIDLHAEHVARSFRGTTWTNTTPIARLKKDFSHDDRSLATASSTHILYTVVPTDKKPKSGLKVIRQDDGKNKQIWSTTERLCSVQVSSINGADSVLATGVTGTIYYTELPGIDGLPFDEVDLEAQGFWMSPPPNSDEPGSNFTTSSAIRTRAKLSNTNPAAHFAVARGRQIHLISPPIVRNSGCLDLATNEVKTDKLLAHNGLSINTGKAGKDFCFSEDDTILASLDKVGKVKFWPLDRLTSAVGKTELKECLYSFQAGVVLRSDEKMSPSSILFLDKERAYTKKVALRYLLIGYQQNQILQLWDLGLRKCVQEIRFPEVGNVDDDGAKGMCSITYHPKSAILCVGHPGRNSIYLIHLSSPKYNVSAMSQSAFLTHLANGDTKGIPDPTSTAIMSGVREYSCASIGQLRSLDMLKTPYITETTAPEDEILFELYLMHAKGVLGIPISRADLGWDAKNKMIKPVNAEECGVATISELKLPVPTEDKSTTSTEPPRSTAKIEKKEKAVSPLPQVVPQPLEPAAQASIKSVPALKPVTQAPSPKPQLTPLTREKPFPSTVEDILQRQIVPQDPPALPGQEIRRNPPLLDPSPPPKVTGLPRAPSSTIKSNVENAEPNGKSVQYDFAQKEVVQELAHKDIDAALNKQFATLYSKLDTDKRVAEAAGAAKQDAMLRLVSSTLTDNVEASLHTIVANSIAQQVLPALTAQVLTSVERAMQQSLPGAVQQQVKTSLPDAVNAALRHPHFVSSIAGEVAKQLDTSIKNSVSAEFQRLQASIATKLDLQLDALVSKQAEQVKAVEANSTASSDSLRATEERITALLATMQAEQTRMAAQLAALQQVTPVESEPQPEPEIKQEPTEVEQLTQLLNNGDYEPATIKWLQSEQQAQLFDDLFVRINPAYLQQVSPLIALSVSIAVTSAFEANVIKRLEWLSSVLDNMDINDAEIRDVIPKIMDVLIQRLQGAYMQIAESGPTDQEVLRKLAALNRQISEIRKALP